MSGTLNEARLMALYHNPSAASELDRAIAQDPAAAALVAEWRRQDAALGALYGPVGQEPVPARLRDIILQAETPANLPRSPWQIAAAAGILITFGASLGFGGSVLVARSGASPSLVADALRAHETYVVEVRHPVEVAGSDAQHLQAWLNKRVGMSFTPPILTDYGYNLLGGRIVPVDQGAAALLMYENAEGARITLYIAAEPGQGETAFRFDQEDGVQSVWWIDGGLGCAVTGDLPREALRAIGTEAYDQILPAET